MDLEDDDVPVSDPEAIRDRELLTAAEIGSIALPPRSGERNFHDYPGIWWPSRALVLTNLGNIELPERVGIFSPEWPTADALEEGCAGAYEVVGVDDGERSLGANAAILRRRGTTVRTWRYVTTSDDDVLAIAPADRANLRLEYPNSAPSGMGSRESVRFGHTDCGRTFLWLENPSGNLIRAFVGFDSTGTVAAVFFEHY